MTKYSIDTDPRKLPIVVMAVIAVLLGATLQPLLAGSGFAWGAPTAFAIFGALYFIFNLFAWKWFEFIHHVPDLSGKWVGSLNRGNAPGETGGRDSTVEILIAQSWSEMEIVLRGTSGAHSVSKVVGLFVQNHDLIEIRYGYVKISSVATLKSDRGSTGYTTLWLTKNENGLVLKGNYFSDNLRSGTFSLNRTEK